MKKQIKEELENKASRHWNEAKSVLKRKGLTFEVQFLMEDAIKTAPTKKSKEFFKEQWDIMSTKSLD